MENPVIKISFFIYFLIFISSFGMISMSSKFYHIKVYKNQVLQLTLKHHCIPLHYILILVICQFSSCTLQL